LKNPFTKDKPLIALDFDGTCVKYAFPDIGESVDAERWLCQWVAAGAQIILWTMRDAELLYKAQRWFEENGIQLHGVQLNPTQAAWTSSPKVYAKLYVDDRGYGVPLRYPEHGRPYVDWSKLGPTVLGWLNEL